MGIVIGLTGGIASGKSTVSDLFKEYNIPVVDADIVAREVVEPGEPALASIVDSFGSDILLPDGALDRQKLGGIIFRDQEKREILNGIIHPVVRERMTADRDRLKTDHPAVVLDIPLLFEGKQLHLVDKVVVVNVDPRIQLERLMQRNNLTEQAALDRINSQMPLADKAAKADAIIDNNGSRDETRAQLEKLLLTWNIKEGA
ncbi:dephospho-CoA kinase [Terribacillus saccharophilus]|uniref:Dephospho-CoA kinase n=1 Tax=Terribacillus saccharophilus TaxID=361277 RepID=A0A268AC65_9BACI|nr:dephospho-CoA kinase [Terribacillus saccharophilus]PAD21724.1 dephospho-CoA kinase [Terribacillus saccharophilus]PAF19934.1 dephospho-CoA kinase [Terribacillus saccharophilus]PAF21720.1 dephospho-CoA kinase [Terribacillus saccharophilus]PAF35093.1 dephospho-CoA kinase [Terribacillus saccharophilus]PAF37936.1 dephospho-CoA kinase [Terribacillus saccharophilus]